MTSIPNSPTDDKPKRIQLKRTKGWRMPPNTVKVARPTKWGNPYKVRSIDIEGAGLVAWQVLSAAGREISLYDTRGHANQHAVKKYALLMEGLTGKNREQYLAPLRGKNLACFCPLDQPCHADVLLKMANDWGTR